LSIRLAFGVRRENDDSCKEDDFISSGFLTITDEVFSEEEKDEPRDKYNNEVALKSQRIFLHKLIVSLNCCLVIQQVHYIMVF